MKKKLYKVYEVSPFPEFEHGNSLRGIKIFERYQDAEVFIESKDAEKYYCLTILAVWE